MSRQQPIDRSTGYTCPVCASDDPDQYLMCPRPMCPDGRDQARNRILPRECEGCAARRKAIAEFGERMRLWIRHPFGPMPLPPIQNSDSESLKPVDKDVKDT